MCLTKNTAGRRADVIIRVALMSMHGMNWSNAVADTVGADADVVTNAHQHRLIIISFDISRANFFI